MKHVNLLLVAAALWPVSYASADSNSGVALFAQTIAENGRISEGYANPEETLALSAPGQFPSAERDTSRSLLTGPAPSVWVSDVQTVLFNDADNDGYFAGFSVTLDADVERDSVELFANIYLQTRGSRPELFHTTNVFSVYEQESADSYRVDVELSDNFSAGDYDLIIDVINAFDGKIEDTVSHRTHNNLSRLPLESHDYQYNQSFNDPYNDPFYDNTVVTTFSLNVGSGTTFQGSNFSGSSVGFGLAANLTDVRRGGAGWVMLLLLVGIITLRIPPHLRRWARRVHGPVPNNIRSSHR